MNCQDIQSKLTNYVGGELPISERSQVEAHLRDCSLCRATLAEIDPLAAVLLRVDNPAVPFGLTTRIVAAARDRICPRPIPSWNPIAWFRLASAPMRAVASIMLIIGMALGIKLGVDTTHLGSQTIPAQDDPLEVYQISYITDLPEGSLADSYLSLIAPVNEGVE